ncbi:hypothetical protein H9K75_09345 [Diaphorobacter aerolatus]|uniref:HEAT repeat domain-containing protein n=1 Tax=Diaphorobacter aerolatus TaxID=1288495 RepID=A0A7H0GP08_9BURK|nr:hypothetical protein H9K75_09345 [Diaphorobacter aerolatus]
MLRNERARSPAAARERFEAALKELGAKERLAMLEVLNERLSMDDEALLERLLTDRSGEVRQLAAEQLSALPESAHAQRVIAWVEPLLRRDGEKAGWTIEPPEKENADWPRDGIAIKPHGFFKGGERAWWLYQLTRMTPPDWWTRHLDMTPEALFAWTGKTEWQRPIRDGLLEAAARAPGRDWLQLLTSMQGNPHARESLNVLLNAMTQTEREAYWQQRLEAAPKLVFELLVRMGELMRPADHLHRTLSDALVVAIAQTHDQTATNRDWSVRHTLSQALVSAALWLAPQSLPGLLAIIDKASSAVNAADAQAQAQSYDQVWQRVRTIAGIRQTLCAIST